ncbi:hypothetical protein KSX_59000 [Ktedonospora formicarum]|uniref:Uncharacterized protein n=1 Tax=Ktedonospora formicarum TaxID=2778364 RepID=A0A8J3I803_9CHLR|nr:hypothetical protein KSX_59000 [Ktedonospora formicarum]
MLKPITCECLCTGLIIHEEDIGLCVLGPPKLSEGISGHRAYFLCNDKRHIMLPNTCDPTNIAQLALLGNKEDGLAGCPISLGSLKRNVTGAVLASRPVSDGPK